MPDMLLKYCAGLLLMLGMGMVVPVSAETATATDTEDAIVAREILQPKAGQNAPAQKVELKQKLQQHHSHTLPMIWQKGSFSATCQV